MKNKDKKTQAQQEEAELESAYKSVSKPGKFSKKGGSRKNMIIAISAAVAALVVLLGAGALYINYMLESGLILDNVTVAGVKVGGMTKADAEAAVTAAIGDSYSKNTMDVTVLNTTVKIAPADSQIVLDVEAAVDDAYDFGRKGSQAKRAEQQLTAATVGYAVDLTPHMTLNEEGIRQILAELGEKYSSTLVQTKVEVLGTKPDLTAAPAENEKLQTLTITMGTPEYALDMEVLYKEVMAAYSANQFKAQVECPTIEPEMPDLDKLYKEHCSEPVDAQLNKETFEVDPSTDGYAFDLETAKTALKTVKYGQKLEFPFARVIPEVTTEALESTLFRDSLASYTAAELSNKDRDVNLSLACKAINGKVIYPGEVFSYNQTLGERTPEKGYKPAGSYENGQTVLTYGGGICQVSTALYYCCLISDMEIVSRACHQFPSGYVPLGMDATVSWGSYDFRFRNNTNYPVRIEASSSGGKVYMKLVGTYEKDYTIKMQYEILSSNEYTTSYQMVDPKNNPNNYTDGQELVSGHTGLKVKTYKCKYSKETGALLSRTYEASSTYDRRDAVVVKFIPEETVPTETTTPEETGGETTPSSPELDGNGGVGEGGGSSVLPPD